MFFKSKKIQEISKIYSTLKKKYNLKENLQLYLKKKKIEKSDVVKMSYDVQSGSYIKFFNSLSNKKKNQVYYPLINILNNEFKNIKTVLDFGCGELTTSLYIFNNLKKIKTYFANDISLNRLLVGIKNLKKKIKKKDIKKFKIFCNSSFNLPFKDNSIDVIISIHSLEPNNNNKKQIINELVRVSRLGIILMEPHYEISNKKQKKRMNKFGYIKNIEKTLKKYDGKIKVYKKNHHINKLNISSLFIFKKNKKQKKNYDDFVEPLNLGKLEKVNNFLYSRKTFRLYPVFNNITIFSNDTQIFLPHLK